MIYSSTSYPPDQFYPKIMLILCLGSSFLSPDLMWTISFRGTYKNYTQGYWIIYTNHYNHPMAQPYKDIESQQKSNVMDMITAVHNDHGLDPDHVKIMTQNLIFTSGFQRLVCEDYSALPFKIQHYLYDGHHIHMLNYSQDPYNDNAFYTLGLTLTPVNIVDYLKFYCDYWVSGSDRLRPVSSADDIEWQEEIGPHLKQSLNNDLVLYPKIKAQADSFAVTMPCLFQQSIMVVDFMISKAGQAEITGRTSLIDDLPVKNFS